MDRHCLYKEEGFKDSYRIALGTTYYMDKSWTFRTGIAYDDSPVPASKRSISIPDQDRLWLSAVRLTHSMMTHPLTSAFLICTARK